MKKSKKIFLLSWCNADNVMNYGQILQAIAMMILTRNATDAQVRYVSYHPRTIKNKVRCFAERHNFLNGHLIPYYKTNATIRRITKKFDIDFLHVSRYADLINLSNDYDLMICGSDQLWHPRNYNPGYFLDFGADSIKRTSYAVSLPKTKIEDRFSDAYSKIEKSLSRFDKITVREQSSAAFIEKLSGKEVQSVLDPTLLIDPSVWKDLEEPYLSCKDKYIFVYIPNGIDDQIEREIESITSKTNVHHVIILMTRGEKNFESYKTIKYVTVGQFLSLIKNADYIYTSSFHAVVFSLIYKKNFLCHDVRIAEQGEDTRLSDLLDIVGIPERRKVENIKDFEIDYETVSGRLSKERMKSQQIFNSLFLL